jgi:hypothetical protein
VTCGTWVPHYVAVRLLDARPMVPRGQQTIQPGSQCQPAPLPSVAAARLVRQPKVPVSPSRATGPARVSVEGAGPERLYTPTRAPID